MKLVILEHRDQTEDLKAWRDETNLGDDRYPVNNKTSGFPPFKGDRYDRATIIH